LTESLVDKIIEDLKLRFPENIIAIYGIGSYFDDSLPSTWKTNDIDFIIIVKDIKLISKEEWDKRYLTKIIEGQDVFYGLYTIESFQDKKIFTGIYGANYEWGLLEMKHPENSKLLYGKDIRNNIPETYLLEFDYDDILARALYHLNKAVNYFSKVKNYSEAQTEFTKAVFKFSFYMCIYHDKTFRSTHLFDIRNKIIKLEKADETYDFGYQFLEEAMYFRSRHEKHGNFNKMLFGYIEYLFNLLGTGKLHRIMKYHELKKFLKNTFNGLTNLIAILERAKENYIS